MRFENEKKSVLQFEEKIVSLLLIFGWCFGFAFQR
jgi:hypothetical protein